MYLAWNVRLLKIILEFLKKKIRVDKKSPQILHFSPLKFFEV